MKPRWPSSQTVTIAIVTATFEGLAGIPCPRCGSDLDLSQPSLSTPDHFTAVCHDCGSYAFIHASVETGTLKIADLSTVFEAEPSVRRPR